MSKKNKGKVVNFQPISIERYIKEKARKLPFGTCYLTGTAPEELKQVIITRKKQSGKILVGFYLIDNLCLGLKETFFRECEDEDELESIIEDFEEQNIEPFEEKDPIYLQNLIYGAIEWAEDAGFKPAKDFKITEFLLDDVEDIEYIDIEFGRNGKHVFFEGPYDNTSKILKTLEENLGKGNFEFFGENDEEEFDEEFMPNFQDRYEMKVLEIDEIMEEYGNEHVFVFFNKYFGDDRSLASSMFLIYYFFANAVWEELLETDEFRYFLKENRESNLKKMEKIINPIEKEFSKNLEGFSMKNIMDVESVILNNIIFEGPNWTLLPEFADLLKVFENAEQQHLHLFIDFMANPCRKIAHYFQNISLDLSDYDGQILNEENRKEYFKKAFEMYEKFANIDLDSEIEDQFFYLLSEIELINNYYLMPSVKVLYESAYIDDKWD